MANLLLQIESRNVLANYLDNSQLPHTDVKNLVKMLLALNTEVVPVPDVAPVEVIKPEEVK